MIKKRKGNYKKLSAKTLSKVYDISLGITILSVFIFLFKVLFIFLYSRFTVTKDKYNYFIFFRIYQ